MRLQETPFAQSLALCCSLILLASTGNPAAAETLTNGGVSSGSISVAGEQDTYTFAAVAGQGYQLQMADLNVGVLYPVISVYAPGGVLLQTTWNPTVANVVRTAASTGIYTVVVSDLNSAGTGPYNLYFALAPGANEGGALTNGGLTPGTIDLGDLDSYTFTAVAGQDFQLQMADLAGTAFYPVMRLYDPGGALLHAAANPTVAEIEWTAGTSGTYTLVVSDWNATGTGSYNLYYARAPGANEGGVLANGGVAPGTIDLGDLDSYTFSAVAGQSFQLQMADLNAGALYPVIRLYDPGGALLQAAANPNVANIVRTAGTTGTYTVVVSDWNATGTGAYDLYFAYAPGANEGGALINGGVASETIALGDLDSYTFAATAGEGFQLQMADVLAGVLYPVIRLYDPGGALLQAAADPNVANIVRTAAITGTYTVVVSDWNATGSGNYDLYFTRRPGANEGGTLMNGGVVSGAIALGDLDSYTFAATAGEGFQLQMADLNIGALYPVIRLYDPGGALLQTVASITVANMVGTAAITGTYTVVVSDWNATGSGPYDLYFAKAPGASEGGSLINGGVIAGTVDLGDLDSYTFEASAGEGFQIQMADVAIGALYPVIRLYDPSGTLLQTTASITVANIVRTASITGTYTVVVSDWNATGTGDYDLYFTRAPGANEGGALTNGAVISGSIDLGDLDSFTFTAFAGEDFQLSLTDVNVTAFYPVLRLYDPGGTLLQTTANVNVAVISRMASITGTYTVVASDWNATGTGSYELYFLGDVESYCTPGKSSSGCMATLSSLGDPSASAGSGFVVSASSAEGSKDGLFFFGINGRQAKSWGNGTSYQCVVPPVKRSPILNGIGTSGACNGSFALDFNTLIVTQPTKAPPIGAVVQIQCWYRDPLNTSNQSTSLSDALEFTQRP